MNNTSLFTFSKSWHESTWLFEQVGFASAGDAILLMQDAVLALQSPITLASFIGKCEALAVNLFALQHDCAARGIENQYKYIELIDYDRFVELVLQHDKQITW